MDSAVVKYFTSYLMLRSFGHFKMQITFLNGDTYRNFYASRLFSLAVENIWGNFEIFFSIGGSSIQDVHNFVLYKPY